MNKLTWLSFKYQFSIIGIPLRVTQENERYIRISTLQLLFLTQRRNIATRQIIPARIQSSGARSRSITGVARRRGHYRFQESSRILLTFTVVSARRSRIVGTAMRGIRPMERQDRGSCGYGLWCRVFAAERPREQRIMKRKEKRIIWGRLAG